MAAKIADTSQIYHWSYPCELNEQVQCCECMLNNLCGKSDITVSGKLN